MTYHQPSSCSLELGKYPQPTVRPILVVVEGQHDIEFLGRISQILHAHHDSLPDLVEWQACQKLIFIPSGGGDFRPWLTRLGTLGCPEFHLYDRELPPTSATREHWVKFVNQRPHCRALLTCKRSLENYLHPRALLAARNLQLEFGDFDDVPELAARAYLSPTATSPGWPQLSRRARRRCRDRQKKWLNTDAVEQMTAELLAERDPEGEIHSWLEMIAELSRQVS